ncbi:DNA-binding response regulator [Amycolatopsis sp. H20-H5]|uniref:DNA-binding response regulator n=1 Tax=Amycolatopsis sp. H20-H5 TaxID=3046309 RepID=UPI002DB6B71A|nr:DNA-binding response regulator [Amycolatopsis sp. H20-H5]MEC3975360.1 DNA-binding response regulator [Amycolatopsis sp. H20-H5]
MTLSDVTVVRGDEELFARTAHLFESATDIACAADNLHTWAVSRPAPPPTGPVTDKRVRKIYRPGVLLNRTSALELRTIRAEIRITTQEINETILLDRRVAILAGDPGTGTAARTYTVVSKPELVQGICSLFEAAWRSATDLAGFDARFAELRLQAPQILDLLSSGCTDEAAARTLGVGLRTYRRRVAELMSALGASSRFQAGARAREAGLL